MVGQGATAHRDGWPWAIGRRFLRCLSHRGHNVTSGSMTACSSEGSEAVSDIELHRKEGPTELTHNWDDPMFLVRSDPARRARYRRLQSWYRQTVLGLNAGLDSGGRPIGSLLPSEAVEADPSLNFLRDERLARIALDRLAENRGTFVGDRLVRNLLSSQPLCVNLFGMLKLHPDAAAAVLAAVTGLPIERVDLIEIERAPDQATAILNDCTAFDAGPSSTDHLPGAEAFSGSRRSTPNRSPTTLALARRSATSTAGWQSCCLCSRRRSALISYRPRQASHTAIFCCRFSLTRTKSRFQGT